MITFTKKIPEPIKKELEFFGDTISVEMNHYAYKADSAITIQKGETVILVTVTRGEDDIDGNFVPLSVEYIEKYYAGGVISSSRFVKRENRPSDEAVLKARQIDHAIRSLFPNKWRKPISLVITVLAYDGENDPEQLAVFGASTALMLSSIPFDGPCMSLELSLDQKDKFIYCAKESEKKDLKMNMVFSIIENKVLNIEGWADEIEEDIVIQAMEDAVEKSQKALQFQKDLAKEFGLEKTEFSVSKVSDEINELIEKNYADEIHYALENKEIRQDKMNEVKQSLAQTLQSKVNKEKSEKQSQKEIQSNDNHFPDIDTDMVEEAVEKKAKQIMRKLVMKEEKRLSGRKLDEIRPLKIEVGVLPRVHGSSVFTRGMTQCLSILTLGSTRMAQTLESFEGESLKRFMHHYTSPNYSFGDAGRFSYYAGRREIGHGNIGENALRTLIPDEDVFPYTIRVNSEIMSSNGSTSMAAACAACLALLDGGVPIKNIVAGVAMGLVTEIDDNGKVKDYKVLTDMEDVEDFYGDMDFKVTGTDKGITAIQLDNKLQGVTKDILKDAFEKSKKARLQIISQMKEVINKPRENLSEYAPKVDILQIKIDQIGELIGPGGKHIKSIIEECNDQVEIDIQDDGTVYVLSANKIIRDKAIAKIKEILGEDLEVGDTYEGVVDKVEDYGIFVKFNNSKSGLVHVSELRNDFVKDVSALYKRGDKVKVKLIGIDNMGRLKLSIKQINGASSNSQKRSEKTGNNDNKTKKRKIGLKRKQ